MRLFLIVGGSLMGVWCRYYLRHFRDWVAKDVYVAYQALFDTNLPDFSTENSHLAPLHCASHWLFFIAFACLFVMMDWLFEIPYQGVFIASYVSIAICIAVIDWRYQLISVQLCYCLFWIGVVAAYVEVSPLHLEQSLQSALTGFFAFYCLYHLSKRIYRKELLGKGDYWLMLGLGSMSHFAWLPLWLFLACVMGLGYVCGLRIKGQKIKQLPFAPFLIFSALCVILPNWYSPSMMSKLWI
ncbi:prepilin peptidase [Pasteurella multocida]|uniref:prepilin peptidase n=1 Tax=Pasteurella multocida TaxID=747 RepID=UPI0023E3A90F|nr:A24 family peptidase [Pasteurella multocida]